ncbi:MAG: rRNA pseudouridine synthase [Dehalococcoidales bacterium]|nr:rRNA pseudouridine synthase [Dehalococcoidales bacterium]
MQPIIKILTSSGAGSRRQMTEAIKQGRIAVNGKTIESFLHPVNPDSDRITINGKFIDIQNKPVIYLMLNKPKGVTSTTGDDRNSITVLDIIPKKYQDFRLYPVGRLDKDSTGLILLTNDGDLANFLTHPRFEQEKEYLVHIEGALKPEEKKKLEKGLELEDGLTRGAELKDVNVPPYKYAIIIHEGKKRQIRRMFAALGHRVLELKRIRISGLKLGPLAEGRTRELTPDEVKALKIINSLEPELKRI